MDKEKTETVKNEVKDVVTTVKDNTATETQPVTLMSESEARELTNSIQSTAIATCVLLQRAHDRQAYKSLGYKTWAEYIDKEFKFSRARSYQLLSQGNVINEISQASGSEVYLTEKEANQIKKELPYITERIKEETKDLKKPEEKAAKAKDIIQEKAVEDEKAFADKTEVTMGEDNTVTKPVAEPVAAPEPVKTASEEDLKAHQALENEKQVAFYYDSLENTLQIFAAMPSAKSLAEAEKLDPERKIELRNSLKYAITWQGELLALLEKKDKLGK